MTNENLPDRYNHEDVETRVYSWWLEKSLFKSNDQSTKPPFCIMLPPPNVTGSLHLGHALDQSIQDCLTRWKRMSGFNVLWQAGTDHAGISTQSVVEKELRKEGKSRREMGREKFLERVWEWRQQYGDRILMQMRRLGASCDWDRTAFTFDDERSAAVRKVFVSLHKKGLIYRGERLVNWSGPLETAISDLEVEHKEVKGSLWHIRYPLEDGSGHLIVATTRPETMLGDTAVAVNPQDERYKSLIGKYVILPLLDRKIPIIADHYVDRAFGSGVVKITPAHDFNDHKIGKTHQLPLINILTTRCLLNENAGPYKGLSVQEARKRVLEDLKAKDLLEKEEPHTLNVGHCSRSGAVVEPFLSIQWFVRMESLATPAKRVVESGTISFDPPSWTKVYLHWMNIIEDWCVSRQLWWGHRIPAWHCNSCGATTVSESDPSNCEHCQSTEIHQDEDVLDTWFSASLWPFATLGWPKETEALKTFYPTNVLVTGHDILFFWVARMIMMGLEFRRDVPFRQVLLHGIIRDAQGRKMSKSLGNGIDPLDVIGKFGADAMRFAFLAHIHSGKDMKFSEQRVEGYRNFMNKIWNATRYSLSALSDASIQPNDLPNVKHLSLYDQWILQKLSEVATTVDQALEQYRFSDAAQALYRFVWYEYCDWYIEFSKPILATAKDDEKRASQLAMAHVLNRWLRLLHPFAPFITEELYQKLPIKGESCMIDRYPSPLTDRELFAMGSPQAASEVDLVKEVITAIRNIRGENRISPAVKIKARIAPDEEHSQKILGTHKNVIMTMGRLDELNIGEAGSLSKCAVTRVTLQSLSVRVIVPLEGLVDIAEEIKRIEKSVEKLNRDVASLSGRLNNENFVKNAAEDVVQADREQLDAARGKVKTLEESLQHLRS